VDFTDAQFERYARHLILDEVGEEGQARLLASRVLIVGAGGLGAPLLLYLAAAGVGTLGIIDDDVVTTDRLALPKVESAAAMLAQINPDVRVVPIQARLTAENAKSIIPDYDLVADGSDNFTTRFLLNDASFLLRKPLVSAALLRFDAQISTYKAYLGEPHPCYRCLFPERPPEDLIPRCEQAGILGALAGTVGSLQATEVLKELLGIGDSLSGRLLIYDALAASFRNIKIKRDPACALCGPQATITDIRTSG
jgi:adenylyltransferase/sulfurtransferase